MADLPERSTFETALAAGLAALTQDQLDEVLALLGDPPDITKVTDAFWSDVEASLLALFTTSLEKTYMAAVEHAVMETGFGVDIAEASSAAAQWASTYGYELVKGVNDTTRKLLQQAVRDYFDNSLTIGQLTDKLAGAFGPVRAGQISITETTRAATEGGKYVADLLKKAGAPMKPIHRTNEDSRVCPVCAPRDGQEITDGQYPPLHTTCRCWTSWEPAEAKLMGIARGMKLLLYGEPPTSLAGFLTAVRAKDTATLQQTFKMEETAISDALAAA